MFSSLIPTSAFDSLWYWLIIGLQWWAILYRPLGVPLRAITDEAHGVRFIALARHHSSLYTGLPIWAGAVIGFGLSVLFFAAITYRLEWILAALLIAVGQGVIVWIAAGFARRLNFDTPSHLRRQFLRLQNWSQAVLFVEAIVAFMCFTFFHPPF